jgi:hypothetical protein
VDEIGRIVIRMGEKKKGYRLLMRKPEGKRLPGRPNVGGLIMLKWILER